MASNNAAVKPIQLIIRNEGSQFDVVGTRQCGNAAGHSVDVRHWSRGIDVEAVVHIGQYRTRTSLIEMNVLRLAHRRYSATYGETTGAFDLKLAANVEVEVPMMANKARIPNSPAFLLQHQRQSSASTSAYASTLPSLLSARTPRRTTSRAPSFPRGWAGESWGSLGYRGGALIEAWWNWDTRDLPVGRVPLSKTRTSDDQRP